MGYQNRLHTFYRPDSGSAQVHAQWNVWLSYAGEHSVSITGPLAGSGHSPTTEWSETNNIEQAPRNRALVFGDKIFWITGNKILSQDFTENTRYANTGVGFLFQKWVLEYTMAIASGTEGRHTGLYIVHGSGGYGAGPRIVALYNAPSFGTSSWRGITYTPSGPKTGTWSESPTFSLNNATTTLTNGCIHTEIGYKDRVFCMGDSAGHVVSFSPYTQTVRQEFLPFGSSHKIPADLFVFQNYMWHIGRTDSRAYTINRYNPRFGGFKNVLTITGVAEAGTENYETRILAFPDAENDRIAHLFLMGENVKDFGTNDGWAFFQISGGYDGTLRSLGDATASGGYAAPYAYNGVNPFKTRWRYSLAIDQLLTRDAGYPTYYLTHERTGLTGTRYTEDQWVNATTTPVVNGFAQAGNTTEGWGGDPTQREFDVEHAPQVARVNHRIGGGERMYSESIEPEPRVWNKKYELVGTGSSRRLRVWFSVTTNPFTYPNGTPFMVSQTYQTHGHAPIARQATITNTSDGGGVSIRGTKYFLFNAASGTDYWMDWDYNGDGVPIDRDIAVCPFVSTTGIL